MSNIKDKVIRNVFQITVSPNQINMLEQKIISPEHKFRCLLLKMLKQ